MKIFLTGKPQIGKSTVLNKFIKLYSESIGGVITDEIIDNKGVRTGFEVKNLKNGLKILATKNKDFQSNYEVAGYKVDISTINNFIVPEIKKSLTSNTLTIIDEIGRMQAFSDDFLKLIESSLSSDVDILATIVSDPEPWSLPFKNRDDVLMIEVTKENRNELPIKMISYFKK